MAEDGPRQDPRLSADARLKSLDERLKKAQADEAARTGKVQTRSRRGEKQGMRILSDLLGIPLGCALIGWLVDKWLETTPWVMLGMLFLGFGIAVRNVLRISREPVE